MGHIHKQHGRIAIETRGNFGFIIHAGYGIRVGRSPVGELKPGTVFLAKDPEVPFHHEDPHLPLPSAWRLRGIFENKVEATCEQTSVVREFPSDLQVEVPGTEEFDESEPLARTWNGVDGAHPHPEFKREDLDDLIDALIEVRDES